MSLYKAVRETLNSKPLLIPVQEPIKIINPEKDYYSSLFYYNDEHKKIYESTGTLAGIQDTNTDRLYFDFDNKDNLELAKSDTLELAKLLMLAGMPYEAIQAFWTGQKGFALEISLKRSINNKQFKNITFNFANKFESFDRVVNDPNRIVRLPNTKHQKSGLYKIPLEMEEIDEMSIEQIQELAIKPRSLTSTKIKIDLPDKIKSLLNVEEPKVEIKEQSIADIDFSKKIKGFSNCKWALASGYQIEAGNRNDKLLCVVATCKALNFSKEQAYYTAKNSDEQGVSRNGGEKCSKEHLWEQVEHVYGPSWKGGQYSCKDGKTSWLTNLCSSLSVHKCKKDEQTNFVEIDKAFLDFESFAKDIEKNTVKTGISNLDLAVRFRTGQMIGILGAPSSGKTSLALEILENTSKQGLLSVFYSLDMSNSELFQKIAQRVTGLTEEKLFTILQTNPKKSEEIRKQVSDCYTNVKFCFDTGISVENIQESITEFETQHSKKVILLMLDYNELLSSPYSDSTASSGYNAGALKKLTNVNQLCTVSLLQPPKVVGDASDEIISYRSIKGSSLLEQCFSIVIGVFRPGFSPKNNGDDDKFMIMNVLKNRLGKLANLKFWWDGSRGRITELNDHEGENALEQLIQAKKMERSANSTFNI